MAYKPKKGGYRHNAITARGHSATRQQRAIITRSPTREEIYQLLVQLALLSSQLDDVIDDLAEFED